MNARGKKKNQVKKFLIHHRYAAAAFLVPALILVAAFAATEIYPFGGNQITIIDMYHQYVPFLSELQYKLQHGGSLFYSWDGAGGHNFWTLLAYYGGSFLNLLLFFFPPSLVVEGITFILVLKVGFSGMFMYLYLKRVYPRTRRMEIWSPAADNWSRIAFGSMYALSAYFLGYFWCIMWIDVMALFPLCMLGLRRLVNEGRPVTYAVSLALIIFCNYYIAIMVCLFTLLYYLLIWFEIPRGGGKDFLKTTAYVALCSGIGLAMASAMFLPTWRSMKNAYYFADSAPEEWIFYHDPLEIVNQLLPNAHLCFRDGLPNLYCGLFVVMLLVVYFISRSISLRTKIVHGLLLAVMFFSLNVNMLDFIWHGLHFPNELPFRYSFVISFLLITMAWQGYLRLSQMSAKVIWSIFAAGLGYYILAGKILEEAVDNKEEFIYVGMGFLAMYTLILMLLKKGMLPKGAFSGLLVVVVAAELLCSTSLAFEKTGTVERDPYLENYKEIEEMAEISKKEFCRTELYDWGIMNCPALYHYRGMGQFASCINAKATELMEAIGLEGTPGNNRYNYVFSTPVLNAMLNMRYMITQGEELDDPRFVERDQNDMARLYENTQPLSIGYMLPNTIRTWQTRMVNPFEVQDDFVRAATNNEVPDIFEDIGNPEFESEILDYTEDGDGLLTTFGGEGEEALATLHYTIPRDGNYYVFVEADQAETIQVIKEDGDFQDLREDCGAVVSIGTLKKGETFDVEIDYQVDGQGSIRSHVCRLDDQAWDRAYELISRDLMKVDRFGDTFIEGRIHASSDGVFTTSVLNEDGWTLYVDGKKAEKQTVGGDFIATGLSAGDHQIRLRYIPSGLIPGTVIMLLGILALIGLVWIRKKIRAKADDLRQRM